MPTQKIILSALPIDLLSNLFQQSETLSLLESFELLWVSLSQHLSKLLQHLLPDTLQGGAHHLYAVSLILLWPLLLLLLRISFRALAWMLVTIVKQAVLIYETCMMGVDFVLLGMLKLYHVVAWRCVPQARTRNLQRAAWKRQKDAVETYGDFEALLQSNNGGAAVAASKEYFDLFQDLGATKAVLLLNTGQKLYDLREVVAKKDSDDERHQSPAIQQLTTSLHGVLQRDMLGLETTMIRHAAQVSVYGPNASNALSQSTVVAIEGFYQEVEQCLNTLVHHGDGDEKTLQAALSKMQRNVGTTALQLSGGGALAMYHLGTIQALIDSNVYQDIPVITGSSGGSIVAACCAAFSEQELVERVLKDTVSTDFHGNGDMTQQSICWFPSIPEMLQTWMRDGILVSNEQFLATCRYYFGDMTFQEAFLKTGKNVCISVSASDAVGSESNNHNTLLLNHISTPHVTLASAVTASCALPGVIAPARLQRKDLRSNTIVDFGGGETNASAAEYFVDGSMQADLPTDGISSLFGTSATIACQLNPHVRPLLVNAEQSSRGKSLYYRMFKALEGDIRHRAVSLRRLGLMPTFFGQDAASIFKQKYHGTMTLTPEYSLVESLGMTMLKNPTAKDMRHYLKYGQQAAWPYIAAIKTMVRLEACLKQSIEAMRCQVQRKEQDVSTDVSITASMTSEITAVSTDLSLDEQLARVQNENTALRQRIRELLLQNSDKSY